MKDYTVFISNEPEKRSSDLRGNSDKRVDSSIFSSANLLQ